VARVEATLTVLLQILETLAAVALLILVAIHRPAAEVGAALGVMYLVHVAEFVAQWRLQARQGAKPAVGCVVYLLPGVLLFRRAVELVVNTLFVRLYVLIVVALLLLTLPISLLDRGARIGHHLGRLQDALDRGVEPVLDALLRAYNAVSISPYPQGETGLVLAVPMPFRERLL